MTPPLPTPRSAADTQGLPPRGLARSAALLRTAAAARSLHRAAGPQQRDAARRRLQQALGAARGVALKLGQGLALGDDRYEELAQGVAPLDLDTMAPVLAERLGCPLDTLFAQLGPAAAAASLGQVHPATLVDGRAVAVKVQYPGMAEALEAELRLARMLPGLGPARTWGFDLDGYKQTFADTLRAELDYPAEGATQARMRAANTVAGRVIPEVLSAAPGVLIQRWEDGETLASAARLWSPRRRQEAAQLLLEAFWSDLLVHGEVHADPHPGNLRVRLTGGRVEVVQYDFGCTARIGREARLALVRTLLALQGADDTDLLACFVAMGFDAGKLEAIAEALPALTRVVLGPVLDPQPLDPQAYAVGASLERLLGDRRWWFRSAGPPSFIWIMRAFHGLWQQLRVLGVPVRSLAAIEAALTPTLVRDALDLPLPHISTPRRARGAGDVARWLRVRVAEGDTTVAQIAVPALQVLELEQTMPADALDQARRAGIDVQAVVKAAADGGLVPQTLLSWTHGPRTTHIWLD